MGAFTRLAADLSKKPGIRNPKALAASIGRKKYGEEGMEKKAKSGLASSLAKSPLTVPDSVG